MVFIRIFRWLANCISGSTVPLASTAQSLGLPVQIVTKYDKMANTTVRAIQVTVLLLVLCSIRTKLSNLNFQSVKPHVPLIKFPRDRPQPKFAAKIGGINIPTAQKSPQSQSSSVAMSSTGGNF